MIIGAITDFRRLSDLELILRLKQDLYPVRSEDEHKKNCDYATFFSMQV